MIINLSAMDMRDLVDELRERLAVARQGGSESAREKHTDRGKLLVRDRVDRLLDPGSPFLELSPLAAYGMYAATTVRRAQRRHRHRHRPGQRARVRGRRQRRHRQGRHLLPDHGQEAPARAGGGAAPTGCRASTSSTPAARSCRCRTRCSPTGSTSAGSSSTRPTCPPQGIPQIAAVMGSCTAGGAYVPAMSDETVIVTDQGTIFLGGPPLVKAATGEVVTAEDLGGGDVHARKSGVVDHLAERRRHALAIVRSIVATLPRAGPAAARSSRSTARGAGRGPRRPLRRGADRHPHAVRRPRGDPPDRRRLAGSTSSRRCTARRWSAGSPGSGATRSASSPTTASCSPSRRSRARTSSSCATSAASRWCSCRTSPASWSAASTRTAASPGTAPSSSPRSPARWCRSSPSSSAARSAPATTACAGAPTTRGSCGCGPTPGSR